ncbi:MAG: hypothetical protein ACYC8W_10095 [Candidatus Tyrphobacter sp.]
MTKLQMIRAGSTAALAVALFGAGSQRVVTSASAAPPLSAEVRLFPTPAHIGTESITVSVRDGGGLPVRGAVVVILPSYATQPGGHAMAMPKMGAVTDTIRAVDANDGTYLAQMRLTRSTHWILVIHVTTAHASTTITRGFEVR